MFCLRNRNVQSVFLQLFRFGWFVAIRLFQNLTRVGQRLFARGNGVLDDKLTFVRERGEAR